ncbi:MAG TPA: hypothetical protein V6C89_03305 [Drouetiella sp.]|jgi:hypothetical protein
MSTRKSNFSLNVASWSKLPISVAFTANSRKTLLGSYAKKVAARTILIMAPNLVLLLIGFLEHPASAQGLVGAPVDPRYGQSNEVGQISDYGYDMARDCCRVITALSTIPATMAGAKIVHNFAYEGNAMGNATRGILTALAVTFGFPTAIHLIGTFAINNFGGLGGGL